MSQPEPRRRRKVLVVESNPATAADLASELATQGFDVAGPFSNSDDALVWLGRNKPDCAIIDIGLRDGFGFVIACELRRQGISVMLLRFRRTRSGAAP